MNTTEIKLTDTLPQIIDDVKQTPTGFVIISGGERTTLRFREITDELRTDLEILAKECKPASRAA